jgi:hypothetical protein
VYDSLSYTELFSGVYIEKFGITKVVIHLFVPDVNIEQFDLSNVAIQLLVPDVYSELFGIAKVFTHQTVRFKLLAPIGAL